MTNQLQMGEYPGGPNVTADVRIRGGRGHLTKGEKAEGCGGDHQQLGDKRKVPESPRRGTALKSQPYTAPSGLWPPELRKIN